MVTQADVESAWSYEAASQEARLSASKAKYDKIGKVEWKEGEEAIEGGKET